MCVYKLLSSTLFPLSLCSCIIIVLARKLPFSATLHLHHQQPINIKPTSSCGHSLVDSRISRVNIIYCGWCICKQAKYYYRKQKVRGKREEVRVTVSVKGCIISYVTTHIFYCSCAWLVYRSGHEYTLPVLSPRFMSPLVGGQLPMA